MADSGPGGENELNWRRRAFEWGFWPALVALAWGLDTLIKYQDRQRSGYGLDDFRLVWEQLTSGMGVLLMLPLLVYWYRRFPLGKGSWWRMGFAHLLGSMLFSLGHFCLLVLFRKLVFFFNDRVYHWRDGFFANLLFEYQKDIGIYLVAVLLLWSYGRYRARPAAVGQPYGEGKLVVQTGRGQTVLQLSEIDYLESARNYLTVHAQGREYLLRDTISRVEQRLAPHHFARTHRSFLVNLERIAEVLPREGGGHRICMEGGSEVPLSRSYRDHFRSLLQEPSHHDTVA
jgi:hypothetical protein